MKLKTMAENLPVKEIAIVACSLLPMQSTFASQVDELINNSIKTVETKSSSRSILQTWEEFSGQHYQLDSSKLNIDFPGLKNKAPESSINPFKQKINAIPVIGDIIRFRNNLKERSGIKFDGNKITKTIHF